MRQPRLLTWLLVAAAYVCQDFACQVPVTGPEWVRALLEGE